MSWTFSRELAAAYSAENCLAGKPFAPLSKTPIAELFYVNAKTIDACRFSRFGTTSRPLTESRGGALLTWWREVSLAKTYPQPDQAAGSKGPGVACGEKWPGSLAKWDPDSSSWKTRQGLLLGGSEPFSEIWPSWGSMQNGECSARTTPELPTYGNASGSSERFLTPHGLSSSQGQGGGEFDKAIRATVQRFPTPKSSVSGPDYARAERERSGGPDLASFVALFPTPAARDYRSPNKKSYKERGGKKKGEQLPNVVGGQLNPDWVEWLMGWPIEWTALKPLETDKYLEWSGSQSRR